MTRNVIPQVQPGGEAAGSQPTKKNVGPKPFHKALPDYVAGATPPQLLLLARQIQEVKIPSGFEEISRAWRLREQEFASGLAHDIYSATLKALRRQKEAAAQEATRSQAANTAG